jgi:hypothetical protein
VKKTAKNPAPVADPTQLPLQADPG